MKLKQSRYTFFVVTLAISTLILTQITCGLSNSGEETPVDQLPVGGETSTADQSPAGEETSTANHPPVGGSSITIVNATDADICTVSATIKETDEHFDNIIGETLSPGDSLTLPGLGPMTLSLVASDCAGKIVNASETQIDGATTWEINGFEAILYEPPAPPPTSPDQTWLVMLYLDADDELIEKYVNFSLNEVELVGSTDQVQIVAQLDRFAGGFSGDGDWTTAKRFYVTQDTDLSAIASEELADIGEVDMADPNTLADFVTWSMENYPADKYVLILSDHGGGYIGGWSDQSASGDILTLIDLEGALAQIQANTGLEQFELIGFEACLLSSLEVYTAIAPYTRYSVASEEVSRAITSLPYAAFLGDLVNNPGMGGAELAESIVRNNVDGDAALIGAPNETVEFINAESTLAAVDLAMLPHLLTALDELVIATSEMDQGNVAQARYYTQSYFNLFGEGVPPSFLDLGHLAQMLAEESNVADVALASKQLLATLEQVVIAEKHGSARPGSTGITLYFPNSTLYGAYDMLPGSNVYTTLAGRFASQSLWDDFLLYHYTGMPMPDQGSGTVAFAKENADIVGPGIGQIEITPITTSSDVFSFFDPVEVSADVTGGHVAWVYYMLGYYLEEKNTVFVSQYNFLPANIDKEVNGVVYPDWKAQTENGVLHLSGGLGAQFTVVTNGKEWTYATFLPETYGGKSGITFVPGTYIPASAGESRPAIIRFKDDSHFLNMYVFTREGFPIEHTPQPGDRFTFKLTLIDQVTGKTQYIDGDTLAFGDQLFSWDGEPAPPGKFIVGITVVDLDGNPYQQSIALTVEE